MKVLVTGAGGFLGKNLVTSLKVRPGLEVLESEAGDDADVLEEALGVADVIFHLAGVNRPENVAAFATGNTGLTETICATLERIQRKPRIVLSSSIQAERENPYGLSKRGAEEALKRFSERTGAETVVYRLKNLFGKWSRPNYNSVTATFCHNVAHGLPIRDLRSRRGGRADLRRRRRGGLRERARRAAAARVPLRRAPRLVPDQPRRAGGHDQVLPRAPHDAPPPRPREPVRARAQRDVPVVPRARAARVPLDIKADARGRLAEFLKSPHFGQILHLAHETGHHAGNHYHHTKVEKFMVVQGEGLIRLRQIHGPTVVEYPVKGEDYRVVDIPPGYTHSIENVGAGELVTLFWSSEVFDPARTDTVFDPVLPATR